MSTEIDSAPVWSEDESQQFIALGRLYTPRRDEILETFLDLIPAELGDRFVGVELGTGAGWLTEGILRRFPNAHMIGLDGSEAMRETTRRLLAPFADRVDIKPFRLEDPTWLAELPASLSLVVSSLVVHHLDGTGKQRLFSELFRRLAPGGAVLICDVVLPASEHGRRVYANAWDAEVRKNSQTELGNQTAYDEFVSDKWNMYAHPIDEEDIDHPSTLLDQLEWLKDAGFEGVDCWWSRAGHAIFGGYKPISDS